MDYLPKKKMNKNPAIVLSSHTIGLGLIRALGIAGIPVIVVYNSKGDMGYVSKYVHTTVFATHPEKNAKEYIDLLIDLAKDYKGSVLFPTDDPTLYTVSKNKELLQNYYKVVCTEWAVTERFLDKKYTYELAESIGVSAPKTKVITTTEDAEKYGSQFMFPCILKPCYGHRYFELYKRKMVRVDNFEQMMSEFNLFLEADSEAMLQELIPGDDTHGINYNSYIYKGETIAEFTAEKVRLSPPNFGFPTVIISKDIPQVKEAGRKMLKALNFYGYSCTEFKRDARNDEYKLMEVNGRTNLSVLHALKCGINFPEISYNDAMNIELPQVEFSQKNGIYWIDSTKDIATCISYRKQRKITLRQFIKPYISQHVDAIFDLHDIKPFIKRMTHLFKMGLTKLFNRS